MTENDYFYLDNITDKLIIINNAMVMQNEQLLNVKNSINNFVTNELQVQSNGYDAVKYHMYLYASLIDVMQYVNSMQISKIATIMTSDQIFALDAVSSGSTISGSDVLNGKAEQESLRYSLLSELTSIETGEFTDIFNWRIPYLRNQISICDDLIEDYEEIITAFDSFEEFTQSILINDESNPVYYYSSQVSNLLDDLINCYHDGAYVYSSDVQERIASLYEEVAASISSEYYVNGELDVDALIARVADTSKSLTPTDYYAIAYIMSNMTDEELAEFLSSLDIPKDRMYAIAYAYRQRAYSEYANSNYSEEGRQEYLRASECYVYVAEIDRIRNDLKIDFGDAEVTEISLTIYTDDNGDYAYSLDVYFETKTGAMTLPSVKPIHREIFTNDYNGQLDLEGRTDLVTQNGVVYYQDSTIDIIADGAEDYAIGKIAGEIPFGDELSAIFGTRDEINENNRNRAFTANALSLLGYANNMGILNGTDGTMIAVGPTRDYHDADTVSFFEVNFSERDLLIASAAYANSTNGSVTASQASDMETDIINSYVNATGIENAEDLQNADVYNDFATWERAEQYGDLAEYRTSLQNTLSHLHDMYPGLISVGSLDQLSVEQTKVLIDYNGHPENIQGDDLALFM